MSLISLDSYDVRQKSLGSCKESVFAAEDQEATYVEQCNSTVKIGNVTVNVRSCFYPQKSLYDILLSIASVRLKEKLE